MKFNIYFRFGNILKFGDMRIFRGGVSDLSYIRAYEHRSIAAALPFVLQDLKIGTSCALLTSISYVKWRSMLGESDYSIESISELQAEGQKLQQLMHKLSLEVTKKMITSQHSSSLYLFICDIALESPKFHKISHWPMWISTFGEPSNFNGETFETFHKTTCKRWMGKLNLGTGNASSTILRRDALSDIHRRDPVSVPAPKRQRVDCELYGLVRHEQENNNVQFFTRIFAGSSDIWLSKGSNISFKSDDPNITDELCCIERIELRADLVVLTVQKYIQCEGGCELGLECTYLRKSSTFTEIFPTLGNKIVSIVNIQPRFGTSNNYYLSPFVKLL